MGTNYYWRETRCKHCGNYNEEHIGKSSLGWTFSFHGTDEIRSYKDWLKRFGNDGEIYNEYDEFISIDDFKRLVESKKKSKFNHARDVYSSYDGRDWLDDEGNSFSEGEFS